MQKVRVYGADWCEDTHATRHTLDTLGVQYEYIDVDKDSAAEKWVKQQNNGKRQTPTLEIQGQILIEPDERELEQALRGKGLMT